MFPFREIHRHLSPARSQGTPGVKVKSSLESRLSIWLLIFTFTRWSKGGAEASVSPFLGLLRWEMIGQTDGSIVRDSIHLVDCFLILFRLDTFCHWSLLIPSETAPRFDRLPTIRNGNPNLSTHIRTRPAFEKLLVGPLMILGEGLTGGHYLEVLRLGKQMTVGHQACPSYYNLHKGFVSETGFVGAFYRGFLPWGLLQCLKGIPVLFVQHESMYQLQGRAGWDPKVAEKVSGFLGGASQALVVCPCQKLKVSVIACESMNSLSPLQACRLVVERYGPAALYDGVLPMMMRRSLDWGIRFSVSSEVKNWLLENKRLRHNQHDPRLKMHELIGCGLVGGAFSALTHPIDNIITNSQKPLPPGSRRDIVSVVRRMYRDSGTKAFTRGFAIKVVDNSYHMAWMYGVGTVLYDYMRKSLAQM